MEKNNILKSSVISGTLILTFTGIISRFISFYYKIFLSRAIGAEGLGIYQLIFPIFALFLAVTSSGIQTAISRSCASCQSERQARGFLLAGISMTLTLSLLSMLLIHIKADWFCRNMMEGINGTSLLYIMLWAIPFAGVHSCINGYYYGRKKAAIPAFSQLFEQMIRVLGGLASDADCVGTGTDAIRLRRGLGNSDRGSRFGMLLYYGAFALLIQNKDERICCIRPQFRYFYRKKQALFCNASKKTETSYPEMLI